MNKKRHTGSVLVMAVWAVFLLSMFAVSIGALVRQKMSFADRLQSRQQLYYIAEAGIELAMKEVRKKDKTPEYDALNDSWSNNSGLFKEIPVKPGIATVSYAYSEDGEKHYGLMDEGQKINLNVTEAGPLASLLSKVGGLEEDAAEHLAYNIIDWRDADSLFGHPLYGAEDSDYENLPSPYECKDAPFEVPEEVLLVQGMSPEIFEKIKNFITVYGTEGININTAPREVLSVYLRETLVDRIIDFRQGEDVMEGTKDDLFFQSPTEIVSKLSQIYGLGPTDISELTEFVERSNVTTKSDYFTAQSTAGLGRGKLTLEISAVIDRNGQILHWQEAYKTASKE